MKKLAITLFLAGACVWTTAQEEPVNNTTPSDRPVITGAPFLRISPDARAGGLGDMGVATSPDAFSQYWNPAKFVFSRSYSGVGVSYTPYLSNITDDVFLMNAAFYTYLGDEERSTVAASIYYFNMGEVNLSQIQAGQIQETGIAKPNEFAVDVSYGLKLSDSYGMAVAARYIRSDLFNNDGDALTDAASSFAVDVAGYYESERLNMNSFDGRVRAGFNVSNIGPKLSYSDSEDAENFLPTNLRVGGAFDFILDDYNRVTAGLEVNKLLVPTPSVPVEDADGNIIAYQTPDDGVVSGIFNSFSDAPDGFSEELKEFTWAVSGEYVYNNAFAFRTGYFHESLEKGGRQYATLGAGLKFNAFGLDVSYLFPTNQYNNALENTLRFALTWDFGGETYNSNY
ncbi:type IX secretion system outer membrane channel protein PorV [Flavobacteriaceae bacterium Ap0902]|nr:type IX secretion system outer membrane channel protein PorV [Flavobacteriaceae bacterium Ap0902]